MDLNGFGVVLDGFGCGWEGFGMDLDGCVWVWEGFGMAGWLPGWLAGRPEGGEGASPVTRAPLALCRILTPRTLHLVNVFMIEMSFAEKPSMQKSLQKHYVYNVLRMWFPVHMPLTHSSFRSGKHRPNAKCAESDPAEPCKVPRLQEKLDNVRTRITFWRLQFHVQLQSPKCDSES